MSRSDVGIDATELSLTDELLGSVSCSTEHHERGKIRISARVFKKMKFDSDQQQLEKKVPETTKEMQVVRRVPITLWRSEEKQAFFEGLNEFGKDFENIHIHLVTRMKKKGTAEDQIKTKPQVRHFYYKTFHFISNFIRFSEHIPKKVQELYSLVNYGEVRRKIGTVTKKACLKLSDLVYNGSVAVKFKGKMIRIKTPMCRALRRLNKLDEKYDDLKLPTRVLVELTPKAMSAYLRVQSLAQNPRIRVSLPLQKRLSCLISCVENRWKSDDARIYDKAVVSTNTFTKYLVPDDKQLAEERSRLNPALRLLPPVGSKIQLPSIDISEYFTGQSICLNTYELRHGVKAESTVTENEDPPTDTEAEYGLKTDFSDITSVNRAIHDAVTTTVSSCCHSKQPPKNGQTANGNAATSSSNTTVATAYSNESIQDGWTLSTCGSLSIGEIYLMFGAKSRLCLEYTWDDLVPSNSNLVPDNQQNGGVTTKHDSGTGTVSSTNHFMSALNGNSTDSDGDNKETALLLNMKRHEESSRLSDALRKLLSLAKLQEPEKTSKKAVELCESSTPLKCASCLAAIPNRNFKRPPVPTRTKSTSTVESNSERSHNAIGNFTRNSPIKPHILLEQENAVDNFCDNKVPKIVQLYTQVDIVQKLRSKRGGRLRGKQLVERNLVASEHDHHIVTMNIVTKEGEVRSNNRLSIDPSLATASSALNDPADKYKSDREITDDEREFRETRSPTSIDEANRQYYLDAVSRTSSPLGLSKILREPVNDQMIDVADYSLSSLLGHLDGQVSRGASIIAMDDSRNISDGESQLTRILAENSVDINTNFEDFVAGYGI